MTEPTARERKAIDRLTPLLFRAGLSEDLHEEFIEGIGSFTTMMTVLLSANHEDAPNYITFALDTPKGDRYELTVRKCEGKTPVEVIDGLKETLKSVGESLADADQSVSVCDEGIRNMSAEEAQDHLLDILLQIRDIRGTAWEAGSDD